MRTITEVKNIFGNDEEVLALEAPVACQDFIEKWLQNLESVIQISVNNQIR